MSRNLLLVTIIVVVIGYIIFDFSQKSPVSSKQSNDQWKSVYQGMNVSQSLSQIRVSTDVMSVRVEPSLDASAHIQIDTNLTLKDLQKMFVMQVKQTGDVLDIQIKGQKKNYNILDWNKSRKAELLLQLPPEEYDSIKLSANIGAIQHTQVHAKQLEITNDIGEINVRNVNTQKLNVKGSIGAIHLTNVTGEANIKNSTGLVQLQMPAIQDSVQINTDIGAVKVIIDEHPEQLAVNLSTELGSIDTNLDMDYTVQTRKEIQGTIGKAKQPALKVKTEIGKVELNTMQPAK